MQQKKPQPYIQRWTAADYAARKNRQQGGTNTWHNRQKPLWEFQRDARRAQNSYPKRQAKTWFEMDAQERRDFDRETYRQTRIDQKRKEADFARGYAPVILNGKVKYIKRTVWPDRPDPRVYDKWGTDTRQWFSFDSQGRTFNIEHDASTPNRNLKHGEAYAQSRADAQRKLLQKQIARNKAIAQAKLRAKKNKFWKPTTLFNFQNRNR